MEVVGVVFIASNHFLAVASFLSTVDGPRPWSGRSAPAHQRLKSQRSVVTAISTAIKHLMRSQMLDKAVTDSPAVHPRRSARTLKMNFTEPVTFGFLVLQRPNGPRQRPDGLRLVSDGAGFSIGRSEVLTYVLQSSCLRFTLVSRTVRRKGSDGPRIGVFAKKLLLSGIIYGIPDNRPRVLVDELIHLTNDQLGKLVSP
jgi:hypothetical protein